MKGICNLKFVKVSILINDDKITVVSNLVIFLQIVLSKEERKRIISVDLYRSMIDNNQYSPIFRPKMLLQINVLI